MKGARAPCYCENMQDPIPENGTSSESENDTIDFSSGWTVPRKRQSDPQVVVTGRYKEGLKGDLIVFTIPLALFELVCIVNVPGEGEEDAPVYVKFKVNGKRAVRKEENDDASEV